MADEPLVPRVIKFDKFDMKKRSKTETISFLEGAVSVLKKITDTPAPAMRDRAYKLLDSMEWALEIVKAMEE